MPTIAGIIDDHVDIRLVPCHLIFFVISYAMSPNARISKGEKVVTRTPRRTALLMVAIALVSWVTLATITRRLPGAALPWLDAALVSISLVAQYMMTRKLLENWLLWIAVDVVYIGLFIDRQLPLTAMLYAVFLVLAIIGYVQWHRSAARRRVANA